MRQTISAIDFGTSKVVCVIAAQRSDIAYDLLGYGVVPYAGYSEGRWNEAAKLADTTYSALREAEIMAKRKVRDIVVGVPGSYTYASVCNVEIDIVAKNRTVTPDHVNKLLSSAARASKMPGRRVLHRRPLYYMLDSRERLADPVGQRTSSLYGQVSCIMADSDFLLQTRNLMEHLGVAVSGHVSTMLAQTVQMIPRQEREIGCVLIDSGFSSTTIAIVQGDGILFQQTVPLGARQIVTDMMQGLGISYEDADALKRRYVFGLDNTGQMQMMHFLDRTGRSKKYDAVLVSEVIEARVEEMLEEFIDVLDSSGYRLAARSTVYLSGGAFAMMRGIRQYTSSVMNRNVQVLAPSAPGINSSVYASVMGIVDYVCENTAVAGRKLFAGKI
ncbi:MAG: cell division protein FtsA [Christensenellales bacterium]|jgi:cell division protein FtsA